MMKRFVLIAGCVCLATSTFAEETMIRYKADDAGGKRWTAEGFASARPLSAVKAKKIKNVKWEVFSAPAVGEDLPLVVEKFPAETVAPTLTGAERFALRRTLFELDPDAAQAAGSPEVEGSPGLDPPLKNCGTDQLHYTSSRLIPSSANEAFPYSPVGQLFFDWDGVTYYCTATVIGRRLIATNGDCLYDPEYGFFDDFVFVPAYYRGEAPFGIWDGPVAAYWADYYYQGQTAGAWGIVELADQDGYTVADYTGRLGNVSRKIAPNLLHMVGYGDNLDAGLELHQVISGDAFRFAEQLTAYGSDMYAPGAPWIQNFNRKAAGQGGGCNRARAAVVGIQTLWHRPADARRSAVGREINANFKKLRQEACSWQPGNC